MDLTQKTKQAYDEKWQEAKEKLELQQQKTLGTNHFLCYFNKFHNLFAINVSASYLSGDQAKVGAQL